MSLTWLLYHPNFKHRGFHRRSLTIVVSNFEGSTSSSITIGQKHGMTYALHLLYSPEASGSSWAFGRLKVLTPLSVRTWKNLKDFRSMYALMPQDFVHYERRSSAIHSGRFTPIILLLVIEFRQYYNSWPLFGSMRQFTVGG